MKDNLFRVVTLLVLGCLPLFPASAKESPGDNNKVQEQNITRVDQNATLLQQQADQEMVKQVIGAVEKVRIIPGNIILDARIDTGATTTSLGVDEIEILNEDGKEWAEITLNDIKSKHEIVSFVKIKQHGKEPLKRPVIRLRLILGEVSEIVDVTLANRSNFKYKLLIGRNFLYERFIVDVSLKHTRFPKVYEEK
ncbi:RimK/LysX family protein [Sulfurovum sp.]|jgi:hypothetical protein|uniref:ATP-dependent zinc protease family protein n=1 Tax=Sulfurovum sp. TaxID=1969726 RepID=UPI002A36E157|nr:RimK/LysX family protein [Sulfurovum sp.]MDD2451673.1 RimK/LysX family protein [Sulfurovum sp.]MDD3500358.1 RimK/LysX family protein [Sulfurovum sp.]MDY0402276.1 RimK/LysX family protein [Sulfurovum sp.]